MIDVILYLCPLFFAIVAFIISAIYKGFRKARGLHFLCFFTAFFVGYIVYHIALFYRGSFLGLFGTGMVYGFDAWNYDILGRMIWDPLALIGAIYLITYFVIKKLKRNKQKKAFTEAERRNQ